MIEDGRNTHTPLGYIPAVISLSSASCTKMGTVIVAGGGIFYPLRR